MPQPIPIRERGTAARGSAAFEKMHLQQTIIIGLIKLLYIFIYYNI